MRLLILPVLPLLAACSGDANHLGNPLLLPISGLATGVENAAYNQRRGQVEVLVKTNYPQILTEIDAGGGPILWQAMQIARVPLEDRPARITQLQGDKTIYAQSPGALVTALMVYGG